ncbi:MAG TPA: 50S ribosomal protein L13 [Dehalococcoidia bacterium]|nr:50S ribosomal protein L13 [Dehalococcoidia bacterium]
MKTYTVKVSEIEHKWHVIDATDKVLGKLATEAARLLMGKDKPMFCRHLDTGDYVIIINAEKVHVSGKKPEQKLYRRHSGYPGGFRSIPLEDMLKSKPAWVIEHAVKGMLPKNRLGNSIIKKLKVYAGNSHPHLAQTEANK